MTQEELDRIMKMVEQRGASITLSDPRLSQIIAWSAICLGTLFTGALTWGVKSINDLNTNVAILIEQQKSSKDETDRLDRRLEDLERWRYGNERGR
jgi:hypothetical protein